MASKIFVNLMLEVKIVMLQQKTLDFLADLRENNTREWFELNRKRYEAAKKDVEQGVNLLLSGVANFDAGLVGLEAKSVMFRIFKVQKLLQAKLCSKMVCPRKNIIAVIK